MQFFLERQTENQAHKKQRKKDRNSERYLVRRGHDGVEAFHDAEAGEDPKSLTAVRTVSCVLYFRMVFRSSG